MVGGTSVLYYIGAGTVIIVTVSVVFAVGSVDFSL